MARAREAGAREAGAREAGAAAQVEERELRNGLADARAEVQRLGANSPHNRLKDQGRVKEMDRQACVFCEITADRLTATFVYRDEHIVAFLDIRPATPGHLLVVPTRHIATLADLDDDLGARMWMVATQLAAALRSSGVPCEGINIFLADGEAASQDVFHTHLHVLPRSAGDGFKMDASAWDQPAPSRDQLEREAESIRAALAVGSGSPSSKDH